MKYPKQLRKTLLPGALAGLTASSLGLAGTFNTDFSTEPAGATASGTAAIMDGALHLTELLGSQQGNYILDDLDGGNAITGFTANFKLLIGGGNGADGFSFNFAPDLPGSLTEEGGGTGLSVCFDTYDNGGGEAPAIDIKKGGVIIASAKGTGGLFRNNAFNQVKLTVLNDQSLSLSVGSTIIFTNLYGAFAASAGQFGLGARTGGSFDNHWVDDLQITTSSTPPAHPFVTSATPQGTGIGPAEVVTVKIQDAGATVNQGSIQMKFNGVAVTPSVGKNGDITTVAYDAPGLMASGSLNTVELTFADTANPPVSKTISYQFTVSKYVAIPAAMKVTPVANKPGFIWRLFANQANQVNSNAKTEAALNGQLKAGDGTLLPNLADPFSQGVALDVSTAPNPENAPIQFEIATVINMSPDGTSNGTFQPDDQMPGVPATDGSNNGIAGEIITYLDLPAGATTMAVASDDGFRTTAGRPYDAFDSITLGEYEGGRGVSETAFTVVVEEAGVYPFRTTWEQGGGGANVEWYTIKADGTRVLINDTANGGVRAYRATSTPIPPYVKAISPSPAPRQLNGVSSALQVVLADGTPNALKDSSVTLKFDGASVTPQTQRSGNTLTLTYAPTGLLIPTEGHTAELSYTDATGGYSRTKQWVFQNLKQLVLPAPKLTEDFESYPEDSQPTGWTAWNFTAQNLDYRDITDQKSLSYENWVLVNTNNVPSIDDGVVEIAPGQTFNGKPVDGITVPLASGNILYAESDSRSNTDALGRGYVGQTQFITSSPFNCSQIKDVVITWSALYMQNQDSYGGVEYSVDGGTTWLPIIYYLDSPDIALNPDGTVDAVSTFTRANTDTSSWIDNGVSKGGKYGDGLGAAITADLGPYVAPRINDDGVEGKRIEVARLKAAGGKADVRLRFSAMGTDSWYYAIDNIAFYDVPDTTQPPQFNPPALSGGTVTISWSGSGTLQEATSVAGPWANSASQANPQTVPALGNKFYRLAR